MNYLDKLWMKPHGLYVWTHKSSIRLKVSNLRCMWWNYVNLEGLIKSVTHTKWPNVLEYDEKNIHVKWWVIMKRKCVKVNECSDNMIRG